MRVYSDNTDDYDRDNHYTGDDDIDHPDYIIHEHYHHIGVSHDAYGNVYDLYESDDSYAAVLRTSDQAKASRQRESAGTEADTEDDSEAI